MEGDKCFFCVFFCRDIRRQMFFMTW